MKRLWSARSRAGVAVGAARLRRSCNPPLRAAVRQRQRPPPSCPAPHPIPILAPSPQNTPTHPCVCVQGFSGDYVVVLTDKEEEYSNKGMLVSFTQEGEARRQRSSG